MKRVKNWGDALLPPEEGKEGNNENFLTGESSNLSNAKWYIQKLTGPDKNKVEKIINILEKYGMVIPNNLGPFRKMALVVPYRNVFLVFSYDTKFFTVLEYVALPKTIFLNTEEKRKVNYEVFKKIIGFINELNKELNPPL